MVADLEKLYKAFSAEEKFVSGKPFGSGHIHDTYKISTQGESSPGYILQRINTTVFRDVINLQRNIEIVTNHIRTKLAAMPGSDINRQCLKLIPACNGTTLHVDDEGDYWRMFLFIMNHRNYDMVNSEAIAFEGGRAIGGFVSLLADLPGNSVAETIPDFHNAEKRIENFKKSLTEDKAGRASEIIEETTEILSRSEEMKIILKLGSEKKIPLRITHNDTKINNVLLDENDKALCVIDLDTVMPGYVHYDFGDAIRTAGSTAAEDETDLSLVSISLPYFEAWTRGFLGETKGILTDTEKKYLSFSPQLITYLQAVRFLTDYLDGDVYYKTKTPHHNLQRAQTQLQLLKSMEVNAEKMEEIVKRFC